MLRHALCTKRSNSYTAFRIHHAAIQHPATTMTGRREVQVEYPLNWTTISKTPWLLGFFSPRAPPCPIWHGWLPMLFAPCDAYADAIQRQRLLSTQSLCHAVLLTSPSHLFNFRMAHDSSCPSSGVCVNSLMAAIPPLRYLRTMPELPFLPFIVYGGTSG